MKNKTILLILTLGFSALTAILSFIKNGDAAIVPFFLAAICFLALIISLVVGASKENSSTCSEKV